MESLTHNTMLSFSSLPLGCCQLQAKYVHGERVNRLFKLAQEKSVARFTDPDMTIAVNWDVKQENKQTMLS